MGLIRTGVLILLVLSLTVDFGFGQKAAKQFMINGMEYGAQGNFNEAKEEFEKALKVNPYDGSAKRVLKVIEDALDQKIKSKTC